MKGYTFPICARCTGTLAGQTLFAAGALFRKFLPVRLSAVFAAVMFADWGVQHVGLRESTNRRRFVTGVLGGYGVWRVAFAVIHSIKNGLK